MGTINFFCVFFLARVKVLGERYVGEMLIDPRFEAGKTWAQALEMEIAMDFFWIKSVFLVFLAIKSQLFNMNFCGDFLWFFLWMPQKMTLRRVLDVAVSLLIAMNVAVAGLQHKRPSGNT